MSCPQVNVKIMVNYLLEGGGKESFSRKLSWVETQIHKTRGTCRGTWADRLRVAKLQSVKLRTVHVAAINNNDIVQV